VTLDKAFYNILFKQEVEAAAPPPPNYFHIFFLFTFLKEAFIRNIILLCINYIIYINGNNAVINKNYGRLKRHYVALQNSHGHEQRFLRNL
jgi:hypothetical protein